MLLVTTADGGSSGAPTAGAAAAGGDGAAAGEPLASAAGGPDPSGAKARQSCHWLPSPSLNKAPKALRSSAAGRSPSAGLVSFGAAAAAGPGHGGGLAPLAATGGLGQCRDLPQLLPLAGPRPSGAPLRGLVGGPPARTAAGGLRSGAGSSPPQLKANYFPKPAGAPQRLAGASAAAATPQRRRIPGRQRLR